MTVGLILGSVLVQESSIGASYFLNPDILAAYVMWGIYVTLLFMRRSASLRGRKALCRRHHLSCHDDGVPGASPLYSGSQVRSPMTLTLIGVNHKTAPIALRERVAISRDDLAKFTQATAAMPGVAECMIVSTCNRVEILAAVEDERRVECEQLSPQSLRH